MAGAATGNRVGNYIHYGVREFGMAAVMNGITLHGGFIPYGGTFLTFSDYCRNALRMAALMRIRSIFVFTHDSIGLGEDGPTHQPVEHVAALRLIPNMDVWRPCDTEESVVAWAAALRAARWSHQPDFQPPESAVPETVCRCIGKHRSRWLRARSSPTLYRAPSSSRQAPKSAWRSRRTRRWVRSEYRCESFQWLRRRYSTGNRRHIGTRFCRLACRAWRLRRVRRTCGANMWIGRARSLG